jgi:hypothetical protein
MAEAQVVQQQQAKPGRISTVWLLVPVLGLAAAVLVVLSSGGADQRFHFNRNYYVELTGSAGEYKIPMKQCFDLSGCGPTAVIVSYTMENEGVRRASIALRLRIHDVTGGAVEPAVLLSALVNTEGGPVTERFPLKGLDVGVPEAVVITRPPGCDANILGVWVEVPPEP